ncbi:MAG: hypothetical protein ACXV5H_06540 [Halobacteriota archaeon]
MVEQERYAGDPQDEHVMRRDMLDKCDYKYQAADVETFLQEKLAPAFSVFEDEVMDIAKAKGPDFYVDIHQFGDTAYHENALEEGGHRVGYAAYSYGARVTIPQGLFYYSFYAMTRSFSPSGPYCMFIKRNGDYYTPDINAVTKEELLDDMKKAFDDATT